MRAASSKSWGIADKELAQQEDAEGAGQVRHDQPLVGVDPVQREELKKSGTSVTCAGTIMVARMAMKTALRPRKCSRASA